MKWWWLSVTALSCTRVLSLGDDLALRDTSDAGPLIVRTVTSFVPQQVAFVAAEPMGDGSTLFAFVGDGGLTVAVEARVRSVAVTAIEQPLGVAITTEPAATVWVLTPLAVEGYRVTAPDVLTRAERFELPFRAHTLRRLSKTTVAAWSSSRLAVRTTDAGVFVSTPFDSELFDVLEVAAAPTLADGGREDAETLVALTAGGALGWPWASAGSWRPFIVEKSGADVLKRLVLLPDEGRALGLTNHTPPRLAFGSFTRPLDDGRTWLENPSGLTLQLSGQSTQPCAVVEALTSVDGDWTLFCRAADGGVDFTNTIDPPLALARTVTAISSDARVLAGHGQALRRDEAGAWSALTPDFGRVVSLFGSASQPVLVLDSLDEGLREQSSTCAHHQTPWLWCTAGGSEVTRVPGRAAWALREGVKAHDLETGRVIALVADAGAQTSLAVVVDDTLVTATNTRGVLVGTNQALATTLPVGPITSLAGTSPRALFAVAAGRLFLITQTGDRWVTTAVESSEAITVWSDGQRGRALMRDGSVRVLPTGDEVVAPTGERFLSAESFCGQTFATTTTGVFRLAANAETARWERLELGDVPAAAFAQARLLMETRALFVLLPGVGARRIDDVICPR